MAEASWAGSLQGTMHHSVAVSAGAGGLLVADRRASSSHSPIQRSHLETPP